MRIQKMKRNNGMELQEFMRKKLQSLHNPAKCPSMKTRVPMVRSHGVPESRQENVSSKTIVVSHTGRGDFGSRGVELSPLCSKCS